MRGFAVAVIQAEILLFKKEETQKSDLNSAGIFSKKGKNAFVYKTSSNFINTLKSNTEFSTINAS